MNRVLRYSMVVEWSEADHSYVVTVPELPGCQALGTSREDAVRQAQQAIGDWVEAARSRGERVPEPKVFTYWSPFHTQVHVDAAQSSPAKS